MPHWWSPRWILRMKLLQKLQGKAAELQSLNLPVPASLSAKIAELEAQVSSQ